MLSFKELLETEEYWIEQIQNQIFREVKSYMEIHNLNQSQLAEKLNVSKGYVSQILNGNANFSIKKLVELALNLDLAPQLSFSNLETYIHQQEKKLIGVGETGLVSKIRSGTKRGSILKPRKYNA